LRLELVDGFDLDVAAVVDLQQALLDLRDHLLHLPRLHVHEEARAAERREAGGEVGVLVDRPAVGVVELVEDADDRVDGVVGLDELLPDGALSLEHELLERARDDHRAVPLVRVEVDVGVAQRTPGHEVHAERVEDVRRRHVRLHPHHRAIAARRLRLGRAAAAGPWQEVRVCHGFDAGNAAERAHVRLRRGDAEGALVVLLRERLAVDPEQVVVVEARLLLHLLAVRRDHRDGVRDHGQGDADLQHDQQRAHAVAGEGADDRSEFHGVSFQTLSCTAGCNVQIRHAG
jgi:hypothetical protein